MTQQTNKPAETPQPDAPGSSGDLDRQYGTIGISAVAAALPYSGGARNPAYAPAQAEPHRRSEFDRGSLFAI